MLRTLTPLALVACAFPFVAGADCLGLCDYETDPNCEDPTRAQVTGTVTVPEAGGAGFGLHRLDPAFAAQLKDVMRDAVRTSSVQPPDGPVHKAGPRLPHTSDHNRVARAKTATERFRPGEIIVRAVEPMRARKAELAAAVRGVLEDAFGHQLGVDVRLCGTPYRCLAEVTDVYGKKLDAEATIEAVLALQDAPFLAYAEKNLILQIEAQPNDEFFTLQWHYAAIDLPAAWDITVGDPSLVAAVVDTGILYNHPDLQARVISHGADLIDDPGVANDGDGRDNDGFDPGDNECGAGCNSFHGSHVAGTIGADTDNGQMVAGVTWAGGLLPVRVLGDGGGSLADIADGIEWAVGNSVDGVNDNPTPADVLNMSLGGEGTSQAMNEAVADAVATGCIVVVAAGNSDEDASSSTPANAPDAIVVAAHGNTGPGRPTPRKASYSNFGNKVDIAAPGGEQAEDVDGDGQGDGVLSTVDDFVTFYQGTSMATPHVAGVAMLLKSLDPTLTQEDVRQILTDSASPDLDCPDGCGAGRMSAAAALLDLQGGLDGPHVIASPSFVRVGKGQTESPVVFKNIGNAGTSVTLTVGGQDRASCTLDSGAGNVGANGQIVATVSIERNADADDNGECTVTASFDGGSSEARVVWTSDVIQALTSVDVGAVKVAGDGGLKVARIVTTTELQSFEYKLFNLDPGTYIVVGLVDTNNNGSYDDDVDAVGIYTPKQSGDTACTTADCGRVTVAADDHLTGADFVVAPGFTPGDGTGGTGDGVLGDACTASDECGGGLYCEPADDGFTGGYCTEDCQNDTDCGSNGICAALQVVSGEIQVCLKSCDTDADCRTAESYFCDPTDNTCFPQ